MHYHGILAPVGGQVLRVMHGIVQTVKPILLFLLMLLDPLLLLTVAFGLMELPIHLQQQVLLLFQEVL